jgi:hypothetical protein
MGRAEDIFERIKMNGFTAIDEFISTEKSEELFLDFKRSADNGTGSTLHVNDRKNLAKAISGFANSEGGVIVWGVDCSKNKDNADVAHSKFYIQNVPRFVSWLEGAISGLTIPPHTKIQNIPVEVNNRKEGFVITYIPKSDHAPHQVVLKCEHQYRYFIRAGSNFEPTPHAVLAGMFGRRPQPHVFHTFVVNRAKLIDQRLNIQIGLLLMNNGPGIASDLFMNVLSLSNIGKNCSIFFKPTESLEWTGQFIFERKISMISKSDFRLPPESETFPLSVDIYLLPPFTEGLLLDCICGSGQSPSIKFRIENDSDSIEKNYSEYIEKFYDGTLTQEDEHTIVTNILNLKDPYSS